MDPTPTMEQLEDLAFDHTRRLWHTCRQAFCARTALAPDVLVLPLDCAIMLEAARRGCRRTHGKVPLEQVLDVLLVRYADVPVPLAACDGAKLAPRPDMRGWLASAAADALRSMPEGDPDA